DLVALGRECPLDKNTRRRSPACDRLHDRPLVRRYRVVHVRIHGRLPGEDRPPRYHLPPDHGCLRGLPRPLWYLLPVGGLYPVIRPVSWPPHLQSTRVHILPHG